MSSDLQLLLLSVPLSISAVAFNPGTTSGYKLPAVYSMGYFIFYAFPSMVISSTVFDKLYEYFAFLCISLFFFIFPSTAVTV